MLTPFHDNYINPPSLACVFSGTNEPTITWKKGGSDIVFDSEPGYSKNEPENQWNADDLTKISTLNINAAEIISGVIDVASITCSITFADAEVTDTLSTETRFYFRGLFV